MEKIEDRVSGFNCELAVRNRIGNNQPASRKEFSALTRDRQKTVIQEAKLLRNSFARTLRRMIPPGRGYLEEEISLAAGDIGLTLFNVVDEKVAQGLLSEAEATLVVMYINEFAGRIAADLLSPLNRVRGKDEKTN